MNYYQDYATCMQRAIAQASLADDIRGRYFLTELSPAERMQAIRAAQNKAEQLALAAEKFLEWAHASS